MIYYIESPMFQQFLMQKGRAPKGAMGYGGGKKDSNVKFEGGKPGSFEV